MVLDVLKMPLNRSTKLKIGAGIVLGGSLLSGVLLGREHRSLNARLKLPTSLVDREKRSDPYIYVRPGDETVRHKTPTRRVLLPWLQSRSRDPRTLLKLALSEQAGVRMLGVRALAQPHQGWTDADYCMLAQALDARALAGLARMEGVDPRLFLSQPKLPPSKISIEEELRCLLSSLPLDSLDPCTKYFTSSALLEGGHTSRQEQGGLWCFGGNGLAFTTHASPVPEQIVETFCLQALEKHSVVRTWGFDGQGMYAETNVTSLPVNMWVETLCLQALLGASVLPSHCPKIIAEGGLHILQRIYESRSNNIKILRNIARILSNLAVHEHLHRHITSAGWISVLYQWLHSRDLALSLFASKALANLDRDFGGNKKYQDGVYLYYPQHRFSGPVYADVVFVHGLMGGPFRTWRQKDSVREAHQKLKQEVENRRKRKEDAATAAEKPEDNSNFTTDTDNPKVDAGDSKNSVSHDQKLAISDEKKPVKQIVDLKKLNLAKVNFKEILGLSRNKKRKPQREPEPYTFCWPKDWLPRDCPNIRVLTVEYDTHLSEWAPKCPYDSEKRALVTRSCELLDKLRAAGVGDRPVIWVAHSMGGLLVKQMLASAHRDCRYSQLVEQSRGIVFYSVPHQGSPLAAYTNTTKYLIYPSVEVTELKMGSPQLLELHSEFRELMFERGIPLLSFAEGQKTRVPLNLKLMIVPPESSDPGFGEFHLMEDLSHLNICKPESRDSLLYATTLDFLLACLPAGSVTNVLRATLPDKYVLQGDEVT